MTERGSCARFWAKTTDASGSYHPLIAHSADVAAVLKAVTEPGTALFDRLVRAAGPDADLDRLRSALIYLAALHDLGKTNHGFQDKNGPWARPHRKWPASGHVIPVIASLHAKGPFLAIARTIATPLPFDPARIEDALRTAIAHHGRPWLSDPQSRATPLWGRVWAPDPESGREPLVELARLRDSALRWSGLGPERHPGAGDVIDWNPALSNLFAGLLTISDWIGSTETIFALTPEADDDPDGYWEVARKKARRAVRQVGVRPSQLAPLSGDDVYRRLFPAIFPDHAPTVLQGLVADIELPTPGTRLVVESETGSGKTEAALALYARLRAVGRVDGLVFALPTRATAKAMYERIHDSLPRLHPEGAVPTIALAMGGQVGESRAEQGLSLDPELYPDPEDEARHRWSSESHKKFFAAEVVVGTVDQVLLAGLPVKHAHMRLALLARDLVVVDEIHSYDRYMNAVMNRVLDFHSRLGGVSAFLSATLSRDARNSLTGGKVEVGLQEAVEAPYPALSTYDPDRKRWGQVEAATTASPKSVSWSLTSQRELGDQVFDDPIRIARAGGRVCILRNTVKDARATVEALLRLAPEMLWRPADAGYTSAYHSRFIPSDRHVLDRAVLDDFGKGSTTEGVILVATQVIEQSLDVDFDWIMTDLAPVDVLLQRIGRLHRHNRSTRPAEATHARLLVQAPADGFKPRREYRGGDFGWGTVYREVCDLELTRRLIAAQPEIVIPRHNRLLVEQVYHPEARDSLTSNAPEWSDALDAAEGRRVGLDTAGTMGALGLDQDYSHQAAQYDQARNDRIRTRIGDDRISVRLDEPVRGWYGNTTTAEEVPLRLGQLHRAGGVDFAEPTAALEARTALGLVYRIGENLRLRYGPEGWVESFE